MFFSWFYCQRRYRLRKNTENARGVVNVAADGEFVGFYVSPCVGICRPFGDGVDEDFIQLPRYVSVRAASGRIRCCATLFQQMNADANDVDDDDDDDDDEISVRLQPWLYMYARVTKNSLLFFSWHDSH